MLKFDAFNERLNIGKINIKDVDTSNLISRFPKPGKTLKESLEDGMIVVNRNGTIYVVVKSDTSVKRVSDVYNEHVSYGEGIYIHADTDAFTGNRRDPITCMRLVQYDDKLMCDGNIDSSFTTVKIYESPKDFDINDASCYTPSVLKDVVQKYQPIWTRE